MDMMTSLDGYLDNKTSDDFETNQSLNMGSSLNQSTVNISTYSNESDYYYYYDYEASIANIPVEEIVPVAIVYGLTLILGVVGNMLVILSILRIRRMRNVTNIFLMSLASADLVLVLLCVPIKFAKWFSFTWDFGEFLCKAVHYLQNVSVICSVLTLTTMSLERHYAILHPMRAKSVCTVKHARVVICIIWILSFVFAAPIIVGQIHKEVGVRRTGFWCIREWPHEKYEKAYELSMLCLVFVIPLFIMIWAYASICMELWMVTSRRRKLTAGQSYTVNGKPAETSYKADDDRTRKQVIKMLVAIIVLFAICHGPSLVDNVLVSFGYVDQLNYGYLKYMRQAFALMSYFNSCINPIVYAFMSKSFRESFRYALCICSKHQYHNTRGYSPAASNTQAYTLSGTATPRPSPYPSPVPRVKKIDSNYLLISDNRHFPVSPSSNEIAMSSHRHIVSSPSSDTATTALSPTHSDRFLKTQER